MNYLKTIFVAAIFGALLLFACDPPQSYPEIPDITFKSLSITDSIDNKNPNNSKKKLLLTLKVIDGDGDIGILGDQNYIYPGFEDLQNTNLFITLFEKRNDSIIEVSQWNYGTPYIEPEGQDKTLKADIEVRMEIPFAFYTYDTIQYQFYIYDREKHKSKVNKSPLIPADTIGIIKIKE